MTQSQQVAHFVAPAALAPSHSVRRAHSPRDVSECAQDHSISRPRAAALALPSLLPLPLSLSLSPSPAATDPPGGLSSVRALLVCIYSSSSIFGARKYRM
jgi:hypothetical protein